METETLPTIKEQIQNDIITFADDLGLTEDQLDALCEIVVRNFSIA